MRKVVEPVFKVYYLVRVKVCIGCNESSGEDCREAYFRRQRRLPEGGDRTTYLKIIKVNQSKEKEQRVDQSTEGVEH